MILNHTKDLKQRILDYLESFCIGRINAITGSNLVDILGIDDKDRRKLREAIHELRESGQPILSVSSKPFGYYIPKDITEIEEGIHEFTGRIIEMRKVCKGIQKGLRERFPGNQLELFDDIGA